MQWLNVELTNRCNKACSFCGRAEARKFCEMELGDMDLSLFTHIIGQFKGSIVQFNKDGEPLLYNHIGIVGDRCKDFVTNIVTNGILLWEKRDEIKDNFTTITVSVIEDDPEQFEVVRKFVEYTKAPLVYIKFLGDYYNEEFENLGLKTLRRTIHSPAGDTNYQGSKPIIPEVGMCLDFLYKPSISWDGNFSICNRYDPKNLGVIGDCYANKLETIWDNEVRKEWLLLHKKGMREAIPLCKHCEFYGVPTNG